jgi:uncharacterized membrane protein
LTRHDLTQEPTADMALWVQHLTEIFPLQVQHFYAFYLLAHGAVKFTMVIMLARRILWAYNDLTTKRDQIFLRPAWPKDRRLLRIA